MLPYHVVNPRCPTKTLLCGKIRCGIIFFEMRFIAGNLLHFVLLYLRGEPHCQLLSLRCFMDYRTMTCIIPQCLCVIQTNNTSIVCKTKRQYLPTCKVSRYYLLALLGSIVYIGPDVSNEQYLIYINTVLQHTFIFMDFVKKYSQ